MKFKIVHQKLKMLHNNELISIEEILVKPQTNNNERPIRQFILFNRNTDLKICIYTLGARVMSCMLSEHQIIVGDGTEVEQQYSYQIEPSNSSIATSDECAITTSTSSNNLKRWSDNLNKNNFIHWDSHVFGSDTILLNSRCQTITNNNQIDGSSLSSLFGPPQPTRRTTLTYCLTKDNEFIIQGHDFHNNNQLINVQKAKLLINPFFFNLNSVDSGNPCLDEHYLHIRTSHESINVFTEHDRSDENGSNDLLYGGQFIQRVPSIIPNCLDGSDFIYSTNPSPAGITEPSYLIATLSYKNRSIETSLQIDRQTKSSLRILIKNGSIAFVPHDMNKFKVTYRFHW